ncbi:MAG: hypothetical protein JW719_14070 [Pirellulales bacterium]|nr:hypothetical protein [Pirellulales bacterium]
MTLRMWLAVGLLAVSWLPGLGYYAPAIAWLGVVLAAAGVALLAGVEFRLPERRDGTIGLVLLLPAVWFMPWPEKVSVLLLAAGLVLAVAPIPRAWPRRFAPAAVASGSVLLAQGVALYLYAVFTARSHDVPAPLATMVGGVARLFGAEAGTSGSTLAVRGPTAVDPLGATWDLLVPPSVVALVVGAAVMLALATAGRPRRAGTWMRALFTLVLVVAAWLPIRLALVLGFYAQRSALADPSAPPTVMNQCFAWWLPALLLVGPVLLAWWFVSTRPAREANQETPDAGPPVVPGPRRRLVAGCLVALGAALLTFPWAWDPIGTAGKGRIRVAERCSLWEPTDAAYDENTFGEKASYTYRVIYDYASHFFDTSRIDRNTPISAESLAGCNVLVLKTPTSRMSTDEVDAIVRFVEHGGGLLMIGDHTNVFKSSTFLNDVARRLGFTFRNDLLFRVGTPYEQPFRAAAVPHPAVMHVGRMDFAVSCSIDPGLSWGRSAIENRGLWSLQALYNSENYHPPAEYRAEMRTGPFVQLWAARYGKGRVLAFTDSTIFSNFCIFQPGKAELMLNMLSWLNHGSPLDNRWTWLTVVVPVGLAGLALLAAGMWLGRRAPGGWLVVLSAGLFGAVACAAVVGAVAARTMPPIQPKDGQEPFLYVIDRGLSEVPLSKGAYTQGGGAGYGLLEQWIPRVHRPARPGDAARGTIGYTTRAKGDAALSGDVLVVICPTRPASEAYRDRLIRYVAEGGRLLVLDAPTNPHSTANGVLRPFGLSMETWAPVAGELRMFGQSMGVDVDRAWRVAGGTPIAEVVSTTSSSQPDRASTSPSSATVAAGVRFGKGTVMAVGFASVLNDESLGGSWMAEPDQPTRRRNEVLYTILREISREPKPAQTPSATGP